MTEARLVALLRAPSRSLGAGERTFVGRAPIDFDAACEQHAAYRSALEELGFAVELLPALEEHPDAVFVEDPAVVLDGVAVLTRPTDSRLGEVEELRDALLRHRTLECLDGESELEGGDVLAIGDVLYVGQSARTNHAGLKQLAHVLLGHGYRVKAVSVRGCLHLKTGCTALDEETLVANTRWVDVDRFPGVDVVPVDEHEPFGANTIVVGRKVLLSRSHPRTAERIAARGFDVRTVSLAELEKAEAGPTCLSLRFRLER